jgi:hypothetical protein
MKSDSATATTWTQSSITLQDYRQVSYGYTQTSAKTLWGANFDPGVSGWVSYISFSCNGDGNHYASGTKGYFNPHINGRQIGYRETTGSSSQYPSYVWQSCSVSAQSQPVGPGANSCHIQTAQGTGYATQWMSYDGDWGNHTSWGSITVQYYTSRETEDELRALRWWDDSLAGRAIHTDGWIGVTGEVEKVKVYEQESMELIWEWESGEWNTSLITVVAPAD